MDFGLGYNSAIDDIRGLAVSGGTIKPAGDGKDDGQTVIFHVHSVSSMSDVKQSLGVSVEAAAVFLGGGGSASFDFSESSSLHSFSAYLLVSSFVTNASTHMLGEQLSDQGNKLVANGQMDTRFVEEFGDLYIKGIESGGTFFATIEVQTTDSTDQTKVAASLSVNAFVGGGAESLKSHFNSDSMQSLSTHHLEINSLQVGGKGASARQFLTVDEMLAAATNFAATVAGNPVSYRVELQDYQSLNLPPPPNAADLQNAKDVLADCGARREAWLQYRNDIAFILANPTQFDTPPVDLSVLDQESATALNQIKKSASTCLNAIQSCEFVATSLVPDRSKLPTRKATPGIVLVPKFEGRLLSEVNALAKEAGVDFDFPEPDGPDDTFSTGDPRPLQFGGAPEHPENHPHSDDEIIIIRQRPLGGVSVPFGTVVDLAVDLAPGVAP